MSQTEPSTKSQAQVFSIRLTPAQRELLAKAAAQEHRSLGNYIVASALNKMESLQAA
jgi:uncharacterized protein (DUF1778 family)